MAAFAATGPTGKFTIEKDGIHPQARHAFYYEDRKHCFWFYAETVQCNQGYDVVVSHATTERFSGATVQLAPQDVRVVEENLQQHFKTFDLFGRAINSTVLGPKNIRFKWMIRNDNLS